MEIKYVVMPISIEEKKKYNREGFRVVDAKFAPEGEKIYGKKASAPKKETPKEEPKEGE